MPNSKASAFLAGWPTTKSSVSVSLALAQLDGCLFLAEPSHTGDNAAMIAFAALVEAQNQKIIYDSQPSIPLLPSLKITQCP